MNTFVLDKEQEELTVTCDNEHLWTVYDTEAGYEVTLPFSELKPRIDVDVSRYLFPMADSDTGKMQYAQLIEYQQVDSEPVRCIAIADKSGEHLYQLTNGMVVHNTGGGKSVCQRNIINHVIAHPEQIKFIGIDLKRVELSPYRKYTNAVIGIATTLDNAVECLRKANSVMNERYAKLEELHANNYLDMENPGAALIVMVDEAMQLLAQDSGAKALSENTIVPSLEHGMYGTMKQLREHDHVYGEDGKLHTVIQKYKPFEQGKFRLTFNRRSDNKQESFIVGAHHLWHVYYPDGSDDVVTTQELASLWSSVTPDDRNKITIRRAKNVLPLDKSSVAPSLFDYALKTDITQAHTSKDSRKKSKRGERE